MGSRSAKVGYETRLYLYALLGGAPAVVIALSLLVFGQHAHKTVWTLGLLAVGFWLGLAAYVRADVVRSLRNVANLVAAVREGDYTLRGRSVRADDALGEALGELNALSGVLRDQRLESMEASALLEKVIEAVDVALFAFDPGRHLRLVNRAGERLLGPRPGGFLGATAEELGLGPLLEGEAPRTFAMSFAGGKGPWELKRATFRQRGLVHELVVLSDLHRALREEERAAWQRLVRVIGHEINNSLAPIQSIAGHLHELVVERERPADWEDDMRSGLSVIARRAESLGRFLRAYAQLARLPPPKLTEVDVGPWLERVCALETRVPLRLVPGPSTRIAADPDQLDQLLINLVRNAAEAAIETQGKVELTWTRLAGAVEVHVIDEGPGIASTENLFVPFFTTKPSGSGIGLVLARQIAEGHGGSLTLEARTERTGCVARLRLPAG
ncbi:sensor histidine kinase [Pendulispora albinea]|uniref:histidine kinase n=1 Tax=Pendulispora albinea TaxID=2741071 RepID=A0ABZ2LTU5_9BACT